MAIGVTNAWGYVFITTSQGTPILQFPGSIALQVMVDNSTPQSDGQTRAGTIQTAMQIWNSQINTVQLVPTFTPVGSGADHNGSNEVFFSPTVFGGGWGTGVLAVTTTWYFTGTGSSGQLVAHATENDLLINSNYSWDSYRGALHRSPNVYDLQRVVLHELGHVLGLDHPDQHGQTVTALMNSTISDLDSLQADDITGAQSQYGARTSAPVILQQPSNQAVNFGLSTQFSVSASGGPTPAFRWQRLSAGGGGWADLSNGGSYAGTGSDVLFVSNTDGAMNGDQFRCVASNGSGNATSNIATLTILTSIAPTVSDPANTTVNVGTSAQFSVSATGIPTPTLQWYRQPAAGGGFSVLGAGATYVGVTSSVLTINTPASGMNGDQFKCVAANSAGSATSNPATLTVVTPQPPVITRQPSNIAVSEYGNASFTIAASSGTPIGYLWQESTDGGSTYSNLVEGNGYSGTTTPVLSLTLVSPALQGNYYRCVTTNAAGTTPTNGAFLVISGPPAQIKISAGRYHSLRLDSTSALYATGTNTFGQLGDGNTTTVNSPQSILLPGFPDVGDIAAGAQHSLFLATTGVVFAAGNNDNGQLGDNTVITRVTPIQLANGVAAIAASRLHSAYVKTDGTLFTVGGNDEGQLGNGDTTEHHAAVQIATNVADLSLGIRQTLFVKSDGTLWATGDLDGSGPTTTTPIQIATGVRTVAAGGYHTLFLKTDGTLWSFGSNSYGQLGDGTTTTRLTPVQIAAGVRTIAAGYFHSAFIKSDNTLWVCGYNSFGQLGDGTSTNRPTPIQLTVNVTAVSASESYTLFTKTDGSLWATGLNANGQFGNYGTTTVSTPILISAGLLRVVPAPSGLTVTPNASQDRLNLAWQPQGTAASFEVWRNPSNDFSTASRIAQNVHWSFYQDVSAAPYTTYYYWIVAVNPRGRSAASAVSSGMYGLPAAPAFAAQPVDRAVTTPATATFAVVVNGHPSPTLQWQRQPVGSGVWFDLSNTGVYSGVTTAILTVSSSTLGMSGDQFRCVATNGLGSATSTAVHLTVMSIPVVAGDMNGDQSTDILWENTVTGDRGFYLMNGTSFASWVDVGIVSTDWRIAGTGDFDGDGKNDILWENTSTGEHYIWFMNGTSVSSAQSLGTVSTDWRVAAAGDFNADGKPDILWENSVTGERGFYLMNGPIFASWMSLGVVSTDWHIAGVGDFNGDHKPDIVWENTVNGDRCFWLMNGTAFSSLVDFGYVSVDWRIGGVGDFNGDGLGDLLWENTNSGQRYIWLMNGSAIILAVSVGTISTDWHIAN